MRATRLSAPKRRTNVSVTHDLLEEARRLGINLSAALEEKLTGLVRAERQRRWLEENHGAIADANEFVSKYGVFSRSLRRF